MICSLGLSGGGGDSKIAYKLENSDKTRKVGNGNQKKINLYLQSFGGFLLS